MSDEVPVLEHSHDDVVFYFLDYPFWVVEDWGPWPFVALIPPVSPPLPEHGPPAPHREECHYCGRISEGRSIVWPDGEVWACPDCPSDLVMREA